MRHAILGAGGVGGLLAASLAHAGDDVVLIVRPESLAGFPDRVKVDSATLGAFDAPVSVASTMPPDTDVLWVTVKAAQLEGALAAAPASQVGDALIIPLLNGIDHLDVLRSHYPAAQVAIGTISVEAERVAPGVIRQPSPFAAVVLAGDPSVSDRIAAVAERLRTAGFTCDTADNMVDILWRKLAFLAPLALTTTAAAAPLGVVRSEPDWRTRLEGCVAETCEVARADGSQVVREKILEMLDGAHTEMRSSMQKDVEAGRLPELDAIGGPVARRGAKYGVPTPATAELIHLVEQRVAVSTNRAPIR